MDIVISNAMRQPIYEQIFAQIKAQIVSGKLKAGAPLPSIRTLAKDLRISVITTKRAYDELEREGYIDTVAGKGCYVAAPDTQRIREEHLRQIEAHLRAVKELAPVCGLSTEDVSELLRLILKEESE